MPDRNRVENLSPEDDAKWHTFVDRVTEVMREVWPDDSASVIVSAQWGDLGDPEHPELPFCMVSSNLPVCAVMSAIHDVDEFVNNAHLDFHHEDNPDTLSAPMSAEDVPEEIREAAYAMAREMGFGPESVAFVQHADISDLNDLPETEE